MHGLEEHRLEQMTKKNGRAAARPGWDWFRFLVREARVCNDSRNVAARAVLRQFLGAVAAH